MAEVVSIKFRGRGKTYFFDPAGVEVRDGDTVVVETAKGLEIGQAAKGVHTVPDESVVQPLRPVARLATDDDRRIAELCRRREREAFGICRKKIEAHGLDMKLVDVECSFEGNKILFFFSSEGRVDFRELVKDLAGVFRTRIELRQIGVRDEARMLGGLGICGRAFCCEQFLDDFQPVSTKMAKTQSMSLSPAKISGSCGRLMCCLRYEQTAYEELVKNVPKNGAFVETPDGYGNAAQVNVLRQTVKVKLDGADDTLKAYDAEDVAAVPGGRPRDGSAPAHVLVIRPKKPKEEPPEPEDKWQMPQMLPVMPGEEPPPRDREPVKAKKRGSNRRRPKKDGAPMPAPEAKPQELRRPRPEKPAPRPAPESAQPQGEGKAPGQNPRRRNRGRGKRRPDGAPGQEG